MICIHNLIINTTVTFGYLFDVQVIVIKSELNNPTIHRLQVINKCKVNYYLPFKYIQIYLPTYHVEQNYFQQKTNSVIDLDVLYIILYLYIYIYHQNVSAFLLLFFNNLDQCIEGLQTISVAFAKCLDNTCLLHINNLKK